MASPRFLSERGARFIADFEGWVDHPYNDPARNATIGYGHLLHYGEVTEADWHRWGHISKAQGLRLLQLDATTAEDAVYGRVRPHFVLQNRFDALVSFVFNLGSGILQPGHTIYECLNSGPLRRGAANALLLYDKDNHGHRLPGLVRRRKAERRLFLFGLYR